MVKRILAYCSRQFQGDKSSQDSLISHMLLLQTISVFGAIPKLFSIGQSRVTISHLKAEEYCAMSEGLDFYKLKFLRR